MVSFDVTHRALSLSAHGSRDAWSGWRTKTWNPSTIEMPMVPRGARMLSSLSGIIPLLDAAGRTADGCAVGDQIKDAQNKYWDVEIVEDYYWGTSFVYRDCHLRKAILYEADSGATTWSKTRPQDARKRTKDWMVGSAPLHIRAAQITKDDDSTQADYAIMFNNPPYPLQLEFRHPTTPVQGLFIIDKGTSEALRDHDQVIRDYEDNVPIHAITIDSTGCSGDALQNKMVKELQYIAENYPEGSQRNLGVLERPHDIDLGGMRLFDVAYNLSYVRTAAT